MNIKNVHVDSISHDGPAKYGQRCALCWEDDAGNRYHVWLLLQDDGTYGCVDSGGGAWGSSALLYKNPPASLSYRDKGYFRTIKMSLKGEHGRKMLPKALEHFDAAYKLAWDAMSAKIAQDAAESMKQARVNRIKDRAEEMYELLAVARSQIRTLVAEAGIHLSNERRNMASSVCFGIERIIGAVDGQNVAPGQ